MAILFQKLPKILHGGDYNPEQWLDRPDILAQDIEMMKKAGVNTVTLGVFSWSVIEPREGEFHFEWLDKIMDDLYAAGIYTVLATPSGARPAWLDEKYPEAMRTTTAGVKNLHGVRHNHCMSSPEYRRLVREMDTRLAKRYGKHPGLLIWHISNEFGGECACDLCREKFQQYLAARYENDIEKLNKAWWTTFWSHRFNSFSQIDPPSARGEQSIHGLNLDWRRFTTFNTTEFMKNEIAVLREITPDIPVTANFMTLYGGLDYHVMAKELDIISWDSYPMWHNTREKLWETASDTAFDHAVMRSFKPEQPFMLMESTPSNVNWHPSNKLKRPGMHKLSCVQAVACGSDTVQYFQWRKGRGSFEQYHGAVVDHLGTSDTRVFKDVAEVGALLEKLAPVAGSLVKPQAALLFDWDNRWAIQDFAGVSKERGYEKTCREFYKVFFKNGIDMNILPVDADFSQYKILVAPMLYLLKPGVAGRLKDFVKNGGQLISTYLTGYVDESTLCWLGGFPGDGLTELFGICAEEIDTLYPEESNRLIAGGESYPVREFCELLRLKGAAVLAEYGEDFYKGMPAVTVNSYGKGKAYYLAARTGADYLEVLAKTAAKDAGVSLSPLPEGVARHVRTGEEGDYIFYLNYTDTAQEITLCGEYRDVLTGESVGGKIMLPALGVKILSC